MEVPGISVRLESMTGFAPYIESPVAYSRRATSEFVTVPSCVQENVSRPPIAVSDGVGSMREPRILVPVWNPVPPQPWPSIWNIKSPFATADGEAIVPRDLRAVNWAPLALVENRLAI